MLQLMWLDEPFHEEQMGGSDIRGPQMLSLSSTVLIGLIIGTIVSIMIMIIIMTHSTTS